MKKFANNNNNRGGNNKYQNDRPKNKTLTLPLPENYVANRNKEIDKEQVIAAFKFLSDNQVFGMLSTSVQITKATLFGDETKKGFMNVGFIKDVDSDASSIDVTFYGSYVDKIEDLINAYRLEVSPRIIVDRDGDFVAFTNFDLIPTVNG